MHGSEDGELQQGGGKAVAEGEDEGGLLSKQLLHGRPQPQVQQTVTLHEVWQGTARLEKLLHLHQGWDLVHILRKPTLHSPDLGAIVPYLLLYHSLPTVSDACNAAAALHLGFG